MVRPERLTQRIGATVSMVALLCLAGPIAAEEETVALRWALGASEVQGDPPRAIPKDTQLDTGARLKFLVEPLSPAAVYLIMQDSNQDIYVLYKQSVGDETGKPTYVPPGGQWFELDDQSGSETFFLLASSVPLPELEDLLARHDSESSESKAQLGEEIVEEIRRLHRAHRNFARPAEKPVMIGGRTRGDETGTAAIDKLAVEVSAQRFYGKTITIDH